MADPQTWENLTLSLETVKGINSTDARTFTTDPIPVDDDHLIAAKMSTRVAIMLHCGDIAALYDDREAFFDAIATIGFTPEDPIWEDLGYVLAQYWWVHFYRSQLLSNQDRMHDLMMEAKREGKDAAKALCTILGIELGKATRAKRSSRTTALVSAIHAYGKKGVDF